MKIIRLSFYLLFVAILISVVGCVDQKLTRSDAESLIKQKIGLPKDVYQEFNNSEIKKSGYYFKSATEGKSPVYTGESRDFPKSELFSYLEGNGLVTITTENSDNQSDLVYYYDIRFDFKEYYVANFTEKARQFVNGNSVKVATLEFGEITGIVERKEFNIAEVNYTTKRTNITPFGNAYHVNEEVYNNTETFTKYDDGWRISN
ncbi:MAG: hypothetical protein LLF93_06135 [Bacteroidales bacterium]|nr:hypothetical protein [Bacteroidales bacterium]